MLYLEWAPYCRLLMHQPIGYIRGYVHYSDTYTFIGDILTGSVRLYASNYEYIYIYIYIYIYMPNLLYLPRCLPESDTIYGIPYHIYIYIYIYIYNFIFKHRYNIK